MGAPGVGDWAGPYFEWDCSWDLRKWGGYEIGKIIETESILYMDVNVSRT